MAPEFLVEVRMKISINIKQKRPFCSELLHKRGLVQKIGAKIVRMRVLRAKLVLNWGHLRFAHQIRALLSGESSVIGKTLAHYEVLSLLGRGGMGEDTRTWWALGLEIAPIVYQFPGICHISIWDYVTVSRINNSPNYFHEGDKNAKNRIAFVVDHYFNDWAAFCGRQTQYPGGLGR